MNGRGHVGSNMTPVISCLVQEISLREIELISLEVGSTRVYPSETGLHTCGNVYFDLLPVFHFSNASTVPAF